jgi:hypothetical protein
LCIEDAKPPAEQDAGTSGLIAHCHRCGDDSVHPLLYLSDCGFGVIWTLRVIVGGSLAGKLSSNSLSNCSSSLRFSR